MDIIVKVKATGQFIFMKTALITGITGQAWAYLAEFLHKNGYEVHGVKRRSSLFNTDRTEHLYHYPYDPNINFKLHYGDLTDSTNLIRLMQEVQPDEIILKKKVCQNANYFE